MTISAELRRIYASAPDDNYYIECMSLAHPGFASEIVYITNQLGGLNAGPGYFQYVPFRIVYPKAGESGALSMQVQIDNVSKSIMDELESIANAPNEPIIVTVMIFLANDLTTIQNDPPLVLNCSTFVATEDVVSFTASTTNLRSRPFPSQLYTTSLYPGLKR